jgi:hypothetical protein
MPTSSGNELKDSGSDYDHAVINKNELHNLSSRDDEIVASCSRSATTSTLTTGRVPQY